VSEHKRVVERYFEGFRQGDHERILGCLTEDVIWDLPGFRHLEDRLVEEGATVVAIGTGQARRRDGVDFHFAYCDVFAFSGDAISRVESYLVPLDPA
jgi:uncharacterized protein